MTEGGTVRADDVAEGTALRVETGGLTLAVFNVEGEFYVRTMPARMARILVRKAISRATWSSAIFTTASSTSAPGGGPPPCMIPIKTYPTAVEDGKVVIEI